MNTAVEAVPAGQPDTNRVYTYDELVAEMPETNQPHELWDGVLIMSPTPSFFHQEISGRFYIALHNFVKKQNLGKAVASPIDMVLSPHQTVQPDIAYISRERLDIIKRVIIGPADLVAEVVSLGGRNRDRIEKKDLYELFGVKEYWIIDPESETVDVLALVNGRYELAMRCRTGEIATSRLLPGFSVAVKEPFARD